MQRKKLQKIDASNEFFMALIQVEESQRLAFISQNKSRKIAIAKPDSTMPLLSRPDRRIFADTYVNSNNFVSLAQSLELANERVDFIHSHLDLITQLNVAAIAGILDFNKRYEFYVNHSSHITAENIYIISANLNPVTFGLLLNSNVDKISKDNLPALLGKFSLSEFSLPDHIHFLESVMPLLRDIQHNMRPDKFTHLQCELENKIKAICKGILFPKKDGDFNRQTPLEVLTILLAAAKTALKNQPFSEAERNVLKQTGQLSQERPQPLLDIIQGVSEHTAAIKAKREATSTTAAVLTSFTSLHIGEEKKAATTPPAEFRPPRSKHSSRRGSYWRTAPVAAGHHITAPTFAVTPASTEPRKLISTHTLYSPPNLNSSAEKRKERDRQEHRRDLNLTKRTM